MNRQGNREGDLREMVVQFIAAKVQGRDEAALTWLLQRVVMALSDIGVAHERILRRVRETLPK
jgi:hypothetical protein